MAKVGFTLDIEGFRKQLERVKTQIEIGVVEGMDEGKDILLDVMRVVMEDVVYNAYNPTMYERTGSLLNSLRAEVDGDTLYIFSDGEHLEDMDNGLPYSYRVMFGHDKYPYDFIPKDGSIRTYMEARNWVEVTRAEIISMTNQSQKFLNVIRNAIQKRL